MHAKITQILNQKMDRSTFLQFTGGVVITAIGLRGLLSALSVQSGRREAGGYGQTPYGN